MTLLPITGDFVRALGWAILHSMWQSFFIYTCLRIVLKLWPMAGARIRYNLSMLSLTGIFTWFLATLYIQIDRYQDVRATSESFSGQIMWQPPVQETAVYPSQESLVWLVPDLERCFPYLVSLYILGMVVMTAKLLTDFMQLRKIRTTRIEPMGPEWDKHLQKLAARLQIPRKVKLLVSKHIQVPVMLGFLKPLILLPVAMVNNLSEAQLEAVLLHELAHVKRNDYLLNIFQSIVETILFFNPFVWLISRTIRIEREHCCDDLVIASTVQPLQYAHALVALEEYRLTANRLTMAAADNKQHLFYRIKRIMEMKTKHLNYSQKFLAVLIIATGLVSIAWLNPAKGKNCDTMANEQSECDSVPSGTADSSKLYSVITTAADMSTDASHPSTNRFRQQLDAAVYDTVLPEPPPPPAPSAPQSNPQPTPAPSPALPPPPPGPVSAVKPAAPLAPLNGNLAPVEMDIQTSTNVNPDVKVHMDQKVQPNFNYNYNFDYQYNQNKDEIRKQVMEARKSVQMAMKQLKEVDMKKVQAEVQAATQNVNWKEVTEQSLKAQEAALKALKNINWEQIQKVQQEAVESLKNINFDNLDKDILFRNNSVIPQEKREEFRRRTEELKKNRAEQQRYLADQQKYTKEQQKYIAQQQKYVKDQRKYLEEVAKNRAEADNMREQAADNLEEVRRKRAELLADASKVRDEARKSREDALRNNQSVSEDAINHSRLFDDTRKTMAEANKAKMEAEKAKLSSNQYREMIDKMAADNLLDPKKAYHIEKNDNGLYINGQKQPDNVVEKYSQYLKAAKHITLKGGEKSFYINTQN